MRKNTIYKICSLVLSVMLLIGSSVHGFAAEQEEHGRGCIPDSQEVIDAAKLSSGEPGAFVGSLPSAVDLSTSPYFPSKIGDQGYTGSCTSFATTYYQYTYEMNKLKGTTANTDADICSPKYVYNFINSGQNKGTSISAAYDCLANMGCVSEATFPYTMDADRMINCNEWCTDTAAMRDALSIRLSGYNTTDIPYSSSGTKITSAQDSDLNIVKGLLANGKVLVAVSDFKWDIETGYGSSNTKSIAYRCKTNVECHAIAIVGYDDNVQYDVNGNGTIEDSEKGAFKIVNSWGKDYENDGYLWVLYDALNGVSANKEKDWEKNCEGVRCAAFHNNNTFYCIYVEEKVVNFVGQLDITTGDKNKLSVTSAYALAGSSALKGEKTVLPVVSPSATAEAAPYSGKLVFDYSNVPIATYYTGYDWYVKFYSTAPISKANFAITDNLGTVIKSFDTLNAQNQYLSQNISLKKGDVDFNGSIAVNDSLQILMYLADKEKLSNVQLFTADVDGDWSITSNDARVILEMLAGKG